MLFNVKITESYTYSRLIECCDEDELSRILHEECPLAIDMDRERIEQLRNEGLHCRCDYHW